MGLGAQPYRSRRGSADCFFHPNVYVCRTFWSFDGLRSLLAESGQRGIPSNWKQFAKRNLRNFQHSASHHLCRSHHDLSVFRVRRQSRPYFENDGAGVSYSNICRRNHRAGHSGSSIYEAHG